jgi:hypothetical protein
LTSPSHPAATPSAGRPNLIASLDRFYLGILWDVEPCCTCRGARGSSLVLAFSPRGEALCRFISVQVLINCFWRNEIYYTNALPLLVWSICVVMLVSAGVLSFARTRARSALWHLGPLWYGVRALAFSRARSFMVWCPRSRLLPARRGPLQVE